MELELGSGDEWEKLCWFLEKDIPVGPEGKAKQYPRVNDKAFFVAFRKRILWQAGVWAAQKVLGYGALCRLVFAAGRVGSLVAVAYTATLAPCITSLCSDRVE